MATKRWFKKNIIFTYLVATKFFFLYNLLKAFQCWTSQTYQKFVDRHANLPAKEKKYKTLILTKQNLR